MATAEVISATSELKRSREDLADESLMETAPADRSQLLAPPKADSSHKNRAKSRKRWRTTQMAEDYVNSVARLMYPPIELGRFGQNLGQGQIAIERPNLLGILTSPLRRPTVMERWSPYEIAKFEGALAMCGKHFHDVQRAVGSKTTKEVVEFYYVWKLTSHYDVWKQTFEPKKLASARDADEDDEDGEEEEEEEPGSEVGGSQPAPKGGKGRGAK